MKKNLTKANQENVLSLLCFDKAAALILRGAIDDFNIFTTKDYRLIAIKAITYLDEYKEPIANHLDDAFSDILEGKDKEKAEFLGNLLRKIYLLYKDGINSTYVISTLENFVRKQKLKLGIDEAHNLIAADDLEAAEGVIHKALRETVQVFDTGIHIQNVDQTMRTLDEAEEFISTGITALDKANIGLVPGTILTYMGSTGSGKSWFLMNCGKEAALRGKKVLHITLELSQAGTIKRYIQSFLSLPKREGSTIYYRLKWDREGLLDKIKPKEIVRRFGVNNAHTKEIERRLKPISPRMQIVVKQFPTGSLSMAGLTSYLHNLENTESYVPDVLLIDYADLMDLKTSIDHHRLGLGQLYKNLRGLAMERNIAIATATQANRQAEGKRKLTLVDLAEDYQGKAGASDIVLAYSQTGQEKLYGLARIYIAKARSEEADFEVLVTQAYTLGQYCLQSTRMEPRFIGMINEIDLGDD